MVRIHIKTKHKRGAKALREMTQLLNTKLWDIKTISKDPLEKVLQINKRVKIKIDADKSLETIRQVMEIRGAKLRDYEVVIYDK